MPICFDMEHSVMVHQANFLFLQLLFDGKKYQNFVDHDTTQSQSDQRRQKAIVCWQNGWQYH